VSGNLSYPGQVVDYAFTGFAGQHVGISIFGELGTALFPAAAQVYDPSGAEVASISDGTIDGILGTNGTYTIRVHDIFYSYTGPYGMSLIFFGDACGAPMSWGLPVVNGHIAELGQTDVYTFDGVAGETINLSVSGSGFNAAAFMWDPAAEFHYMASCTNSAVIVTLTNTGTYTVLICADHLFTGGWYSLNLSYDHLVPASYRMAFGTTNGAAVVTIWGMLSNATTIQWRTNLVGANGWQILSNFSSPWSPYRLVDWSSTNSQC
jgi:hypothetical protein